jgi:hypothetical protein
MSAACDNQRSGEQDLDLADLVGGTEWPYVRLYLDVSQAAAAVAMRALEVWNAAMETDWRAAADFLAYRFPERWAPAKRGSRPDPAMSEGATQH